MTLLLFNVGSLFEEEKVHAPAIKTGGVALSSTWGLFFVGVEIEFVAFTLHRTERTEDGGPREFSIQHLLSKDYTYIQQTFWVRT